MRGICEVQFCPTPNDTKKIHEDFESLTYGVCWECGDKIIDTMLDQGDLVGFKKTLQAIEEELK
jgi:hypothetical protein